MPYLQGWKEMKKEPKFCAWIGLYEQDLLVFFLFLNVLYFIFVLTEHTNTVFSVVK